MSSVQYVRYRPKADIPRRQVWREQQPVPFAQDSESSLRLLRASERPVLSKAITLPLAEVVDTSSPDGTPGSQNWRSVQAQFNDRMAKLSDAYAAAYEGDVQFAISPNERAYLVQRGRRHRRDAERRRAAAKALRANDETRAA